MVDGGDDDENVEEKNCILVITLCFWVCAASLIGPAAKSQGEEAFNAINRNYISTNLNYFFFTATMDMSDPGASQFWTHPHCLGAVGGF